MSDNFETAEQTSRTPEGPVEGQLLLPATAASLTPSESTGSEPQETPVNAEGLAQDELEGEGNGFESLPVEDQVRIAQEQGLQHLKVISSVLDRALFLGIDADNVAFAKGYIRSMIQVASQKVEGKENSSVEAKPFAGVNPRVGALTREDVGALGRAAKRRSERAARRAKRGY